MEFLFSGIHTFSFFKFNHSLDCFCIQNLPNRKTNEVVQASPEGGPRTPINRGLRPHAFAKGTNTKTLTKPNSSSTDEHTATQR